jgi:ABC-type uncharacterized transport system substrate-binding protein
VRRRDFTVLLGCASIAGVGVAFGEASERLKRIVITFGLPVSDPQALSDRQAFAQGLHDLGWDEGSQVLLEAASTAGKTPDDYPEYYASLVRSYPDLILVAAGSSAVARLRQQTRTIPIVFAALIGDPVALGLIASRSRPGGNVTGLTNFEDSLSGKWLEYIKEIAPRTVRVAVIFAAGDRAFYADPYLRAIRSAAASLAVEIDELPITAPADIDGAIASFARKPGGGLIAIPDQLTLLNRAQIADAAAAHRLPSIYSYRIAVADGGLMSYGANVPLSFRQAATYVDRIFKGAVPGEMPVESPTKYELIINLKTAKALGLQVPVTMLARADEVIE